MAKEIKTKKKVTKKTKIDKPKNLSKKPNILTKEDIILNSNDSPIENINVEINNEINNDVVESKTNIDQVSEANITFFEKFEKTKKDMLKEKRAERIKVMKSLRFKNRSMGFENRLRDEEFVKNSWIAFITLSVLFFVYACVCLGLLGKFFNGGTDPKWAPAYNLYGNGDMNRTIIVFSSIIVALIPIPYIYLMGTWFIGINGVHKSKHFFIMIFSILIITLVLFVLIVPMSSVIFNKVNFLHPSIGDVGGGGGDTGGSGGDGTTPE